MSRIGERLRFTARLFTLERVPRLGLPLLPPFPDAPIAPSPNLPWRKKSSGAGVRSEGFRECSDKEAAEYSVPERLTRGILLPSLICHFTVHLI